ncbi:MAG: hypothetical protein UY04_C0023G0002 [Parcubacteria group bacterium GW2011_GWA2_47_7]|nr:MAG: hypothetical protein UY04_C0023G0002 [Parcubacteria group bacterium GW2011_GWA2_47_7]
MLDKENILQKCGQIQENHAPDDHDTHDCPGKVDPLLVLLFSEKYRHMFYVGFANYTL